MIVPGACDHFALRKWAIAQEAKGAAQVVVIAGGLDLLAARLAREGIRAFELDRAPMQARKRRMLGVEREGTAGIGAPTLIACDLSVQSVLDALTPDARFDPLQDTLFAVEGLTMYLREGEVRRLLRHAARAAKGQARLVATLMQPGPDGCARFPRQTRALDSILARSGERFRCAVACDRIGAFLGEEGWRCTSVLGPGDFANLPRAKLPPGRARQHPVGEFLAIARADRESSAGTGA
jgi:methyltransferase (TIGR00027 family)